MKILFKWKYPKLALLLISIIVAYFFFSNNIIKIQLSTFHNLRHLGMFVAGVLFSFGFTTPFAIGLFFTLPSENIFLSAIIGGFGAMLSDLFIFNLIKFSFMDEYKRLEKTRIIRKISMVIKSNVKKKIQVYFTYVGAGIIIASPLPDEVGVTMLAGLTNIEQDKFTILSFLLNTLGILLILSAAS